MSSWFDDTGFSLREEVLPDGFLVFRRFVLQSPVLLLFRTFEFRHLRKFRRGDIVSGPMMSRGVCGESG